jgi:hypothetical protein
LPSSAGSLAASTMGLDHSSFLGTFEEVWGDYKLLVGDSPYDNLNLFNNAMQSAAERVFSTCASSPSNPITARDQLNVSVSFARAWHENRPIRLSSCSL